MENIPLQNFYKSVESVLPKYRYNRLALNNMSSTTVQFLATSSQNLEFKIPACTVLNPARSFLTYQYTVPPLGAGQYPCVFSNALDFRTVSFRSQSGIPIVDLQEGSVHVNALRPIRTKLSDFLTMDPLGVLSPSNMLQSQNLLPFSRDGLTAGTENASTKSYTEQQYLQIAPVANTNMVISRYVPLSCLVDTFLALDKDVVFGQDMILSLGTQYLTRMFYYTTTPNNPSANVTVVTANLNISNIYLQMAVEANTTIKNSLLNSLSNGKITIPCPYIYQTRFSQAGSSISFSQSLTISKAFGRYLKRVAWIPYAGGEYTQHAFNHCNLNGSKVTQYQTYLNAVPQTDQMVNCYNPNSSLLTWWGSAPSDVAGDYRENKDLIAGSVLQDYSVYQTNFLHADVFGMKLGESKWNSPHDSQIFDGYDLSAQGELVWQINCQTPAIDNAGSDCKASGLIHYVNQLFQRQLSIMPSGFSWDF